MYSTNRTHLYDVGKQALSTYINGIMVPHVEEPTNNNKGDLFFVGEIFSSYMKNDNGDDMYSVLEWVILIFIGLLICICFV
jgi:hypothetical protein